MKRVTRPRRARPACRSASTPSARSCASSGIRRENDVPVEPLHDRASFATRSGHSQLYCTSTPPSSGCALELATIARMHAHARYTEVRSEVGGSELYGCAASRPRMCRFLGPELHPGRFAARGRRIATTTDARTAAATAMTVFAAAASADAPCLPLALGQLAPLRKRMESNPSTVCLERSTDLKSGATGFLDASDAVTMPV